MSKTRLEFARLGEQVAADFLKRRGYRILSRNYKTKLGEIDIIAQEKETLVFVEVKSRHTDAFGGPESAINKFKQNQISKAALTYLKENNILEKKARFDIVAITFEENSPRINLIKDAFDLGRKYSY